MRRWIALLLVSGFVLGACGRDDGTGPGEARTYYESLDLGSPEAAVATFTEAFAADDFMTVWLALDSEAQFRFQQYFNLLEYDGFIRTDAVPGFQDELRRIFDLDTMEMSYDGWYVFDQVMLLADRHGAFPIDLSGKVTLGDARIEGESAALTASVTGIGDGVEFRLERSPSGRWKVLQVLLPGGDPEAIPWGVAAAGS